MKRCIGVAMLAVMLGWAAGCRAAQDVFVSIPPQKWLVAAVGKQLVDVSVLVRAGQDPHTFEPTPRQVAALCRAKIWFVQDMEFEKQLTGRVRDAAPGLVIADMSQGLERLPMEEAEHHAGETPGEAMRQHDLGHGDPHVWLSPKNLMRMSGTVAEILAKADPANAEAYRRNRAAVQQELAELDRRLASQLMPWKGSSFYVFHPSFGYFARDYGLEQVPVEVGGKSPRPRQLAELIARARQERVKVIFVQPQFDPKSAQAVASAIGGEVVPLDALAEDVPANLQTMAKKIEAAQKK